MQEITKEDIYKIIPKEILSELFEGFELDIEGGIHGFSHWSRVIDNGLFLAPETGANPNIIIAFGLFHDVRREFDGNDPEHGYRGGLLLNDYRDKINLTDEEIDKVIEACTDHTSEQYHSDPDIGTCWDSDRLDLNRAGIYPDENYLSTEYAQNEDVIEVRSEIAEYEEMSPWALEIFDEIIEPILEKRREAEKRLEQEQHDLKLEELLEIVENDKNSHWKIGEDTIKIKLYHGTTEDRVNLIRKEGLKSVVQDPNWYMLSTNFGSALYHANADKETQGVVLELEIELPHPENEFFWYGHQLLYPEYKHENNDISWFALSEVIPPEMIKKVHKVDHNCYIAQKHSGFDDLEEYNLETIVLSNKKSSKNQFKH